MALSLPVLALLDEPDQALQEHALRSLDERVNEIWPEVADHIARIEELYENPSFQARTLAALVAAKVYYNLGDSSSAVHYALASGSELDLNHSSEFVDTIIAKCTSIYIEQRQAAVDLEHTDRPDPEVEQIVEKMLERCVKAGDVSLALGIALECRRLDLVEQILAQHPQQELFHFVLSCSVTLVANRSFRTRVLRSLARFIRQRPDPDHVALVKIVIQLDDDQMAVEMFKSVDDPALSLQIAFDLVASASQELLAKSAAAFSHSPKPIHAKLVKVLSGVPSCDFEVTFLKRHNHVDVSALNRTKNAFDSRTSMFHSAVSFQNAFLHVGTTADGFFRSNIDWLGRASHWTKFTATAALGVIHRGNLTQGRRILQPYLPSGQGSAQSRGGALYGLGLVFAGFGKEVLSYLQQIITDVEAQEQSDDQDVVLHGACLGISLAAMRTGNTEVYDKLREVLFHDSAIAGEAAGLAMGLVMLGSRNQEAQEEMFRYAGETQHEKIQRSLAMGIALLNYGKEEGSDGIIETLMASQEAILRYGGCFTIALAYAGTGNNKAIKMLLHTAVSDASDDVRRAAVIGLGFILLRNPTALPRMVELLSESYNPHVRYGTTMALGIACAGTALPAAVDVLEPMMKDPVDYVRQGAMIALAMILIQQTDQTPRVKQIREQFASVIGARHEDAMAKFGAALAQGIIDAGGCNVTISLERAQTGNLNMKAVVGLAVFLQYWYWFPLAHFLSLAFTPTTVVCVRDDLKIPDFSLTCNASKKLFGYPPRITEEDTKAPEKLVTAILSTTLKDKRKKKSKKSIKNDEMDVDEEASTKTKSPPPDTTHAEEQPEEIEEDSFQVPNMSRVVPWQRRFISFDKNGRFTSVINRPVTSGVTVVIDKEPTKELKVIKTLRQVHTKDDEDEEAPVPAPFVLPPS